MQHWCDTLELTFLEHGCTCFCKHTVTLNFRSNCSITCLVLIWLFILILVSDPKAGVKTDVWNKNSSKRAWVWGLLYSMAGTQKDINQHSAGTKQAARCAATVATKPRADGVLRRAPLVRRTTANTHCATAMHTWNPHSGADPENTPRGLSPGPSDTGLATQWGSAPLG